MSIKVVIADDQAMVRAGLKMILEAEPDIKVVAEVDDGNKAITAVSDNRPDVILMDIQMPVLNGLDATKRITSQFGDVTKVLILTTFERDDYIFQALRSGASGFILKNAPPEDLVTAIRVVAEGNALFAPSVTRRIIAEFAHHPSASSCKEILKHVTDREKEVLLLLAKGRTNIEIAEQLFISEATVKSHISSILSKLDLRDRVQAVIFCYECGLVEPGIS
jgi:DNA-binding NarL/FixJ family response regulator